MDKYGNKKMSIEYDSDSDTDLPKQKSKQGLKKEKFIREIPIDFTKAKNQTELTINGIKVYFPHVPYENQIVYMSKVIEACNKGQIAGLESPTGTGKTLCLLCASLAWLQHKRKELSEKRKNEELDATEEIPKIYYSSRTHSQLGGVIKELKKTCYMPRTAILSSREKMCVNAVVKNFKGLSINIRCKQVRKKKDCKYFYGSERLLTSNYDNCDIEELYNIGSKSGFCPFYFERNKKDYADIVFLPYNYIFEPLYKKVLDLKLQNSILIVDEAHNIESVCEEAVSCQLSVKVIDEVLNDFKGIKILVENPGDSLTKDSILKTIEAKKVEEEEIILTNIRNYIKSFVLKTGKWWPEIGLKLSPKEMFDIFYEGSKGKTKGQMLLQQIDNAPCLTPHNLLEHINFLQKIEAGLSEELQKGSVISEYIALLSLVLTLSDNYLSFVESNDTNPLNNFCNNYKFFINDVEETTFIFGKKNMPQQKNKVRTLFLYCFNPGFGFKEVNKENIQAMIITSGTLSPIEGIESELKCSFPIKLENTHVVDKAQISFSLLTNSFRRREIEYRFDNANRNNIPMIEDLGYTISELCKITPGGVLVFFPSFTFLNTCTSVWAQNSILSEIEKSKEIFKDLHDSQKNKGVLKNYTESNRNKKYKGGILFSVCRGTTSEGIDFSDDYARMVILVGIPYPNLGDVRVQLKREFLDEFSRKNIQFIKDKNIKRLTGSEWYSQCASRTVNQALGRVIRHIGDYGAMVLIDSRYRDMLSKRLFSGWMRDSARIYNDNRLLYEIKNFFERMKTFVPPKKENKKLQMIQQYQSSFDDNQNKNKIMGSNKNLNNGFIQADKVRRSDIGINGDKNFTITNIDTSLEKNYNNKIIMDTTEIKPNVSNVNLSSVMGRNGKFIKKAPYANVNSNSKNNKKEGGNIKNNLITSYISNPQKVQSPKKEENVFDNINTEDLMTFLNENIGLFDDGATSNQNNTARKQSSSKKKVVMSNSKNSQQSNASNISYVTPLKPKEENVTTDIKSDALIRKLIELKERSQLKSLLDKYNLNLVFESEEEDKSNSSKQRLECPVCFESKKENPSIKFSTSKCGHLLCNNCWEHCLKIKMECPLCKKKVRSNTLIPLYLN